MHYNKTEHKKHKKQILMHKVITGSGLLRRNDGETQNCVSNESLCSFITRELPQLFQDKNHLGGGEWWCSARRGNGSRSLARLALDLHHRHHRHLKATSSSGLHFPLFVCSTVIPLTRITQDVSTLFKRRGFPQGSPSYHFFKACRVWEDADDPSTHHHSQAKDKNAPSLWHLSISLSLTQQVLKQKQKT